MYKKSISFWSIIFVFSFLMVVSIKFNLWKTNRIVVDAPSYYTYLPAVIIYKDLKLNFIDDNPTLFKDKIWYYKIDNGNKLIKHPMGLSVCLSPFFVAGHLYSKITGKDCNGYSFIYQNAVTIGVWIYLFLGLFYIRKFLLHFFSEKIVALTLLVIVVSTNLFWYSTFEALMPHSVSFSLWCICMYLFYEWQTTEKSKYILLFSICLGLSILIRPLSITFLLFFIIWGIYQKDGIQNFIRFLSRNKTSLLLAIFISFLIASFQLLYWKYITGSFLYDVYKDEHFIFNKPEIWAFLFSFRKGLFIYTPIMLFSLIGFCFVYKNYRTFFLPLIIVFFVNVFLISSWWAWSYGICWGMRPMIDYYSVLSIPLAASFQFFTRDKIVKYLFFIVLVSLTILNLFQTWQYKKGLIHYDDMSKEAYIKGFFQTEISNEWLDALKPYNWNRRVKGLAQIEYSEKMLDTITFTSPIYFRASNFYYTTCSGETDFMFAAISNSVGANEQFFITKLKPDSYSIKASNGKYLSLKPESHDIVVADADMVGENEEFNLIFEKDDDNRIRIKARNGKFLIIDSRLPLLRAVSDLDDKSSYFRFYLLEDYNKNF